MTSAAPTLFGPPRREASQYNHAILVKYYCDDIVLFQRDLPNALRMSDEEFEKNAKVFYAEKSKKWTLFWVLLRKSPKDRCVMDLTAINGVNLLSKTIPPEFRGWKFFRWTEDEQEALEVFGILLFYSQMPAPLIEEYNLKGASHINNLVNSFNHTPLRLQHLLLNHGELTLMKKISSDKQHWVSKITKQEPSYMQQLSLLHVMRSAKCVLGHLRAESLHRFVTGDRTLCTPGDCMDIDSLLALCPLEAERENRDVLRFVTRYIKDYEFVLQDSTTVNELIKHHFRGMDSVEDLNEAAKRVGLIDCHEVLRNERRRLVFEKARLTSKFNQKDSIHMSLEDWLDMKSQKLVSGSKELVNSREVFPVPEKCEKSMFRLFLHNIWNQVKRRNAQQPNQVWSLNNCARQLRTQRIAFEELWRVGLDVVSLTAKSSELWRGHLMCGEFLDLQKDGTIVPWKFVEKKYTEAKVYLNE